MSHNMRSVYLNLVTDSGETTESPWLAELKRLRDRFEAKVDRRGDNDCWPWRAGIAGGGYGCFRVGMLGKRGSHRLAWMLAHDCDVPDGLDILHSCDNPPCCNPRHLSPGTHSENIQQAYDRGRTGGVRKSSQSLPEETIRAIRLYVAEHKRGPRDGVITEAARIFGVTQPFVSMLMNGKRRQYDGHISTSLEQAG